MVFTMNKTKFGILLEQVEYIAEEISRIDTATASGHIRGTTILRDEVIPVYDLASRFGYEISMIRKPVIVVSMEEKKIAIEVEKIAGIKYMEEYVCEEMPVIIRNAENCVQQAVSFQGELILVLNIDKLV